MAITNASRLSDFGSGIGTEGAIIQVDNTNARLGIGTINPQAMLQVGSGVSVYGNSGIVSATAFYGDGQYLDNISSDGGLGTPISDASSLTNQIYYTARQDTVAAGTSVSVESGVGGGGITFTKLNRIDVGTGATFHVGSGTTLIMNVLGVF